MPQSRKKRQINMAPRRQRLNIVQFTPEQIETIKQLLTIETEKKEEENERVQFTLEEIEAIKHQLTSSKEKKEKEKEEKLARMRLANKAKNTYKNICEEIIRQLNNIDEKLKNCEENYQKQQQLCDNVAFQIQTTVEARDTLVESTLQNQLSFLETQYILFSEPTNNLENTNELNRLKKQISVLENLQNNTDGSASQIEDQIVILSYQQTNCNLQLQIYYNEKQLLSNDRKKLLDQYSELQNEIKNIINPQQTSPQQKCNEDYIDLTTSDNSSHLTTSDNSSHLTTSDNKSPLLMHSLLSHTPTSSTSTKSAGDEEFLSTLSTEDEEFLSTQDKEFLSKVLSFK